MDIVNPNQKSSGWNVLSNLDPRVGDGEDIRRTLGL
jgi:hypothetical protein